MASIMCAPKLWRALLPRAPRRPPTPVPPEPLFQNVIFGPWAATSLRADGRDLVVAIDAASCLTVVFPLGRRDAFQADFARALASALEDVDAPAHTVALETSVIESLPIVRLTDVTLKRTLHMVEFFCDVELGYHADLRSVQRNLNQLPHEGRDPSVPALVVAAFVDRTKAEWNAPLH